jgi:hypothetical protein
MSRGRSDSQDSTNRQKLASYSHLRLINYMKSKLNTDTDMAIYSYTLNPIHDAMLLEWYNPYVVQHNFKGSLSLDEDSFVIETNNKVINMDLSPYDFIIFIRIDMYIKKYFLLKFTKIDNSIRYGHRDYIRKDTHGGVCHNLIYIPKKDFNLLGRDIYTNIRCPHIFASHLLNNISDISIDWYIDTYHSLSTDDNWNPLYSQVGRSETFNIIRDCPNGEQNPNNEEYNLLLNTDTIEENLKLLEDGKFDITLFV